MSSTATTNDPNVALNIEEIVGLMPLPVQDEARLAFYAEWNGEFERAAELAAGLLEKVPYQDELRLLRMRSLFSGGRLQEAKDLCQELLRELPEEDEPHLYMGLICHAFGSYQQAVRELDAIYPPDTYYPYYYSTYGDCLEKLGRREQAREMFAADVLAYEKSGHIPSVEMLAGSYQHLLDLDAVLDNGLFREDFESFKGFLEKIEMTEARQKFLASTIVLLSRLLDRVWFRLDFLDFVSYVDSCEYLQTPEGKDVLLSAYTALESYLYHEDKNITAFMESYLSAAQARRYGSDQTEKEQLMQILSYEAYVCRYYPDHKDEFAYVRENYHHTWTGIALFIEALENGDPDEIFDQKVRTLIPLMERPVSEEQMKESLERSCKRAFLQKKQPVYITDGKDTYIRRDKKIRPNDPCPCGSGKKYKKCHGLQK